MQLEKGFMRSNDMQMHGQKSTTVRLVIIALVEVFLGIGHDQRHSKSWELHHVFACF